LAELSIDNLCESDNVQEWRMTGQPHHGQEPTQGGVERVEWGQKEGTDVVETHSSSVVSGGSAVAGGESD